MRFYFKQNDVGLWEVWSTYKLGEFPTMQAALEFIERFSTMRKLMEL